MPHLQAGSGGKGDSTWAEKSVAAGRLVCDTYLVSKEVLKSKDYKLKTLAETQLNITKEDINPDKIIDMLQREDSLVSLCKSTQLDCSLCKLLPYVVLNH